jgi:N-acetylmuramoyl-L-alanine amidase
VFDPGAVSKYGTESGIVSYVAEHLVDRPDGPTEGLSRPSVELTPELSIPGVVRHVNSQAFGDAALLVLHMNASDNPQATGLEVVVNYRTWPFRSRQGREMGEFLAERMGLRFRGVVKDCDTPAGREKPNGNKGLPILRDTNVPAFLIELGFVSNPSDVEAVKKHAPAALNELITLMGQGAIL